MSKVSDKYVAGFLDADGSIGLTNGDRNVFASPGLLRIEWSQKSCNDEVLKKIQQAVGGTLSQVEIDGRWYSRLGIYGYDAMKLLNRIAKHLVLKRRYAYSVVKAIDDHMSLDQAIPWLKEQRKIKTLPIPNYPPRKWLAGYFDGDGCLHACVGKDCSSATIKIHIACSDYDSGGIETLQKNFGGFIAPMNSGNVKQYCLTMPPSKAIQLLSYFGAHCIVKKDQVNFVLGCAAMGHFRDGEHIVAGLKQLKQTHPHRLNEPKPSVDELLKTVQDIQPTWDRAGRKSCLVCASDERPHVGNGMCGMCYQRTRKAKLQSERAVA